MTEGKGVVTIPTTVKVDQTPRHQLEHKARRYRDAEWKRERTLGFMCVHNRIEIDDKRIAERENMPFYEVKSFGQTLDWSLNKVEIMAFYDRLQKPHIEERENAFGKLQKYVVKPTHITVWEVNPHTYYKRRIK